MKPLEPGADLAPERIAAWKVNPGFLNSWALLKEMSIQKALPEEHLFAMHITPGVEKSTGKQSLCVLPILLSHKRT